MRSALIVSTIAGALLFDSATRIGEPRIGLPAIQMPILTTSVLVEAIQPALILAFLSSIYNLLTALIIDPIAGRNHKPNRELFGLGGTLAWIPNAAFAGILIKVGWDMMDVRFLRRLPKLAPDIGLVTLLTAVLSTFVDVISAIAVGFFISGMANAMRSQRQEINQAGGAVARRRSLPTLRVTPSRSSCSSSGTMTRRLVPTAVRRTLVVPLRWRRRKAITAARAWR